MNKIKLEILGLSSSHSSQSGSFALVLGEEDGNRRLPIIIGMFEAQAIAIEMEKIVSNRPMTHDLFKSLAQSFDIALHEVVISDLKEGVFYAKIMCSFSDESNFVELDARPSDAIAISLRFDVPVYVYGHVLEEAGIELSDIEEEGETAEPAAPQASAPAQPSPSSSSSEPQNFSKMSVDQLEGMMQQAIEREDYERAAKIRDEINKRQ